MKVHTPLVFIVGVACVGQVSAKSPTPTKVITLDYDIVPTWGELGTNANSFKIKLNRINDYWGLTEARDKRAVKTLYSTSKEDNAAVDEVEAFYDGAKKCLDKQKVKDRKTRADVDTGLKEIKECIAKTVSIPTFTVLTSVNLPSDYYSPIVVDYESDVKSDEDADLKEFSKVISLDTTVPSWDELGTNPSSVKIKLNRLKTYWAAAEARDKKAAATFYAADKNEDAAVDKVKDFYNVAEDCLEKQAENDRKTRPDIDAGLKGIRSCIEKKTKPLDFTVVKTVNLAADYSSPLVVDYSKAIKEDTEADIKEATKDIKLDYDIVPTWSQLGTNSKTKQIRLKRIYDFWDKAEARDKKAVKTFYNTKNEDTAAANKVDAFYDGAKKCLNKQNVSQKKTRAEVDVALQQIRDCINKEVKVPVFTVLASFKFSDDYFSPVASDIVDGGDDDKDEDDATPSPVVTAAPVGTPATPPPTKELSLDYDIVPTWEELGVAATTQKIRLIRVFSYWTVTEARDKKAVNELYATSKDADAAATKLDDFYDGAKACLAKQQELERKTRTEIDIALQQIRDCIIQSVVPPIFTVLKTVSLPEEYFWPIVVDFTDTNVADAVEDAAELATEAQSEPEITTAPLVAPEATTASPAELAGPVITEAPSQPEPSVDTDDTTDTNTEPSSTNAPVEEIPVPVQDPSLDDDMTDNETPQEPPTNDEPQSPSTDVIDNDEPQPGTNGNTDAALDTDNVLPGVPDEKPSAGDIPTGATTPIDNVIANEPESQATTIPTNETPAEITTDILDGSVPVHDLPDAQAVTWPFSPASPDVPPRWALDSDDSQSVDANEWQQYIERLHTLAREAVVRGSDPVAVALLKQIVDFHYGSLAQCITTKLKAYAISVLSDADYEPVAQWIETNCYVKFRYSLLAGAPPFEWIAKDKSIVTAREIETWFSKRVQTARKDLTRLANVSPAQTEIVERFIGCAYASLNAAGDAPIHRDAFYSALTHIEQCANV